MAATGRLSSSDPNLQNIPTRTEDGRQIRQAFVPGGPGWKLLTADYSQIELRVLAHFSQIPRCWRRFATTVTSTRPWRLGFSTWPRRKSSDDQRRVAKTVNFGVVYGIKPFGLASRLGISQKEAGAFIESYFAEYAGVDAFITRTLETAPTNRTGGDDSGPSPADQRDQEHDRPRHNLAERTRDQHGHSRVRRPTSSSADARRRS